MDVRALRWREGILYSIEPATNLRVCWRGGGGMLAPPYWVEHARLG